MINSLRFGVIGTGYFGKHYVRLLNEIEGAELIATANRSSGPEIVLNNPQIDCVVIATPVSTHFDLAKRALEAGKHVLVEKPMTASLREAEALQEIVRKSGRIFMAGHQYLYNDYVRHLKTRIDEGILGRVKYVFAEHLYHGPIRYDVGCFWETATHELAVIDYLFGSQKIKDVRGKALDFYGSGRDDFTTAVVTFASGISATIITSWFYPEKVRRMVIGGEKGLAIFDERNPAGALQFIHTAYPAAQDLGERSYFFKIADDKKTIPQIKAGEPLRNELEHFIECVRSGAAPLTDIEHGVRITRYLDTIMNSLSF